MAVTPVVGLATQTPASPGVAIDVISPNQSGGFIVNPLLAVDQGIAAAEVLYINQVTVSGIVANGTTLALQPGQSYTVIPLTTTPVTVASQTPGHKFTAIMWP
jgi:hypothetical protein